MNKEERLKYIKQRYPQLEENHVDAVLPFTKADIEDEMSRMDGYREYVRDQKEHINSDEI